jgi:hypothetical protein
VSRGGRRGEQARGRGLDWFYSSARPVEERERERGRSRAEPRTAVGGGVGRRVGKGGSRRWTAADCTTAAGEAAPAAEQGRQRSRGGSEEEGGEKVRGLMWKIKKIQGLPCKVKLPINLKL